MGGASCHVGELTRGQVVLGATGLKGESSKPEASRLEGDLSVRKIVLLSIRTCVTDGIYFS